MKKKLMLSLIALLLLIGLVFGYYFLVSSSTSVNYLTEPVTKGDLQKTVIATGVVSAVSTVDVGAQTSGQIKKLYVKIGQKVKAGELIAEIDSVKQQNDIKITQSKLTTYKTQLASAKIANAIAQKKYQREVSLLKQDATSKQEYEEAENNLAAAKAKVTELLAKIQETNIELETQEKDFSYVKITAPMDATVVSVAVEEGQIINAMQYTPTIVTVADLSKMKIKVEISEGDLEYIKPGLQVMYNTLANAKQKYETVLQSIDPAPTTISDKASISSSSTNSSTSTTAIYYYGNLEVDNLDGRLHIGMTTQNTIIVDKVKDALIVPNLAIENTSTGSFVKILNAKQQIERRQITTGLSDNLNTQVLSGVKENEQVITSQSTAEESTSLKPRW